MSREIKEKSRVKITNITLKIGYDNELCHDLVDRLGEVGTVIYASPSGFYPIQVQFEDGESFSFREEEMIIV